MQRIVPFLCFLFLSSGLPAAAQEPIMAQPMENARLVRVVALARHGVRAPVQSPDELRQWSQKKWPAWPVGQGDLTPRGAELVSALWSGMRREFAAGGLLPADGCPSEGAVYVYADAEERTRATADALLQGLAPGCGVTPVFQTAPGPDPLFHPTAAGVCRPDEAALSAEVDTQALSRELAEGMNRVAELVGPADPAFCTRHRLRPGCTVTDVPSRVILNRDGTARLEGGLATASSLGEIWLLQAAQWPAARPAWNLLDTNDLLELLPVHTQTFNAVQRAPSMALPEGSALLSTMSAALAGVHPDPAVNAASLVVFSGHDTSIAHVASLLGIHWRTGNWPADAIPPGAILLLTLWKTDGGASLVRAGFACQGMDVFRSDDPQTLQQAAPQRVWTDFGFSGAGAAAIPTPAGPGMPLADFVRTVESLLDPLCLPR